ncbi:carboxylating nicotinate-nucleotide diphosphorylase [SAR86 cluster bacterium]|jgi:nicotinate-nucleotide pyrophosphorylase|nr:carboxylating nicotinate-nucleotide diphosphorylase [SAR86 cluster bacterium]
MLDKSLITKNVKNSLLEDEASNDLSKLALAKTGTKTINAVLTAKEDCIISGIDWFNESFILLDSDVEFNWYCNDGDSIKKGADICFITGKAQSILSAERTALNFLQFMSGISTKTKLYLTLVSASKIQLLDTRKTLPGLRYEQKYSTRIGGAKNHRFNLADGLMLKDNHLKILGGIENVSYEHIKSNELFYEIEVKEISEIESALNLNPDIIMFDNFSIDEIKKGASIVNNRCKIEVSGLKSKEELKELSLLDIDYISMGDLTKNISSIDFSLNIK